MKKAEMIVSVINSLRDCGYKYDIIKRAFNKIEKDYSYELEKKNVKKEIVLDKNKLFGVSIGDAISYLKTFKQSDKLEEVWDGYEDNHFSITYTEEECDGVYKSRIWLLAHRMIGMIEKADKEIARLNKEIEDKKKEIAKYRI